MSLTKADLEALAGLMDSKIAAAVAPQQEAAPVATAAPTKAQATSAKAATVVKRSLDPVEVGTSTDVGFRVVAHSGNGAMFTKGARVIPTVDGKTYRSFDENMIVALSEDGVLDKLVAAISTVNKRALLGSHAPAKAEVKTA